MRMKPTHGHVLIAAAGLLLLPAPATAQDAEANNVVVADVDQPVEREDDNDFPWGLLGLLGLAGLLGLKKRDDDIRVDARRDTRP